MHQYIYGSSLRRQSFPKRSSSNFSFISFFLLQCGFFSLLQHILLFELWRIQLRDGGFWGSARITLNNQKKMKRTMKLTMILSVDPQRRDYCLGLWCKTIFIHLFKFLIFTAKMKASMVSWYKGRWDLGGIYKLFSYFSRLMRQILPFCVIF